MRQISLWTTALAIALTAATPARADDETLRKELDALRAQVAALQARSRPDARQLQRQRGAQATPMSAPAPATSSNAPIAANRAPNNAARNRRERNAAGDSTRFWGYGELNYNHPTGDACRVAGRSSSRRARLQPRVQRRHARLRRTRMGARRSVAGRSGRERSRAALCRASSQSGSGLPGRTHADSARASQRASRADQLLRRRAQLRRDRDHSFDVARRRHCRCSVRPKAA